MNVHLMLIHNGENVGDKNQSLGIATAISDLSELSADKAIITREEYSTNTQSLRQSIEIIHGKIASILSAGQQLILISAGLSGLVILHALKSAYPHIQSLWSGHQVFEEVGGLFASSAAPDFMAFPKHQERNIPGFLKERTSLILTEGVPHNVSESTIELDRAAFRSKRRTLPEFLEPSAVVILPGDAPDMSGVEKLFTVEDALVLAERIYAAYPAYSFVITNGRRTGKHLGPSQAHRNGSVDDVTQAFFDKIFALSGREPALYDFQFSLLPSAYKPLLHAVKTSDSSILLCPGESTSMVTETLGYLPRHKVVIMDIPEVMSEAHYGHLSEVMKMGGVQILGSSGGGVGVVHSEAESSEAKSIAGPSEETAAIQIARVFWRSNTKSLTAEASALALA